jgi:thiol:disulfide interchange protein
MQTRSRYEILKDFFFYYGCVLSLVYAMQIAGEITGKKLPFSDAYQNPYGFFTALIFVLIALPYFEKWGRKKTISDYFPNIDNK